MNDIVVLRCAVNGGQLQSTGANWTLERTRQPVLS